MHAVAGDEITIETDTIGQARRRGEVLEVLPTAGEHYRVRWDDGHETLLFPGPDTRIRHLGGGPAPAGALAPIIHSGQTRPVGRSAAVAAAAPGDPVRTIMATCVATVDGGASLRRVAELLAEAEVGALVVVNGDAPVGILSERDVVRAMARGTDLDAAQAADLAALETVWGETTDSIRDVAGAMRQADVRHIPLREQGRLAGIVSERDVLSVLLGH